MHPLDWGAYRLAHAGSATEDHASQNERSSMVFATDYPFLDILWSMIVFFAWVAWIWILIVILTDVFRRDDIGGWAKAAWTLFLIVLPFVGVLVYLIGQHDKMTERRLKDMRAQQAIVDEHIKAVSGSDGPATEIANAKKLLDSGAINETEFAQIKQHALAS